MNGCLFLDFYTHTNTLVIKHINFTGINILENTGLNELSKEAFT